MGGRSVRGCMTLAAVAAGLLLATAPASPAAPIPPGGPRHLSVDLPASAYLRAELPASNGNGAELTGSFTGASEEEGEPQKAGSGVAVTVGRGDATATYSTTTGFDFDGAFAGALGPFGRIVAHFVPHSVSRQPYAHGCDGDTTIMHGVLRGTIAFRGEGGYVRIRAAAVRATLYRHPKMHCELTFPSPAKAHESHESIRFGGDLTRHSGRTLFFTAYEHPALGTATLLALEFGARRDGVSVTRQAKATVAAREAPFDREAGTASVTAAPPFAGSARFRAFPGRESGTWLGPLAVDFPGRPGVHLAGRRFEGSLLSGNECGPDEPNLNCIGIAATSPIGLGPARGLERALDALAAG